MEDNTQKTPDKPSEPPAPAFTELPAAPVVPVPPAPSQGSPAPKPDPDDLNSINIEQNEPQQQAPLKPRDLIPKKSRKPSKKIVIILLVVIALIGLGLATYALVGKSKPAANDDSQTAKPSSTAGESSQTDSSAKPRLYKNDALKIELTYNSDWTLKEDEDKVTITSPKITYKKKDGTSAKNPFTFFIQKGVNQTDTNTINSAVAVQLSELVKYKAPVEGQRTESYLSFMGKNAEAFKFFLISSGKQFNPGDKVNGSLPLGQDTYVVAGGYGTASDDTFGFDEIAVDDIEQNDVFNQAVDIVKSLKLY